MPDLVTCKAACLALIMRNVSAVWSVREKRSSKCMIWGVLAESAAAMDQPRGLGQRRAVEGS